MINKFSLIVQTTNSFRLIENVGLKSKNVCYSNQIFILWDKNILRKFLAFYQTIRLFFFFYQAEIFSKYSKIIIVTIIEIGEQSKLIKISYAYCGICIYHHQL